MTPYRKKLIEVALPLAKINEAAAKEKSIRHGHPSTLHLWWARRPLAACRAVLFASLVDDPDSDPLYRRPDGSVDVDGAAGKRTDLFTLIEELVRWENSNNPRVINQARAEIARCVASRKLELGELKKETIIVGPKKGQTHHKGAVSGEGVTAWEVLLMSAQPEVVNAFLAEHAPPVLDPFCGGGSIPLEAQRLGLRAYASDLNPVAVLITKALIEIPPKFAGRPPVNPESCGAGVPPASGNKKHQAGGTPAPQLTVWQGAQGLAADVRYYGQWMRDEAEKRIGHLYPKVKITKEMAKDRPDLKEYVGQELTVIAWLWARTIECPNPSCRARAPLVRSFWLSKKKAKECYAKPILDRDAKSVRFEIALKGEPPKHTTDRNGARCLFCDTFIKKPQLRDISVEHGVPGIPLAIVAEGKRGRVYLAGDVLPGSSATKPAVPFLEQPIINDRRWFSPPLYGMPNFADLFTSRQLVALTTFSDLVQEAREKILVDARAAWPELVVQASRLPSSQLPDTAAGTAAPQTGQLVVQASRLPSSHESTVPAAGTAAPQAAPQMVPTFDFTDPRTIPFVEPRSRGYLPHLYKEGGSYFVTFRLWDAVVSAEERQSKKKAGGTPAPQNRPDQAGLVGQPSRLPDSGNQAGGTPAPQNRPDQAGLVGQPSRLPDSGNQAGGTPAPQKKQKTREEIAAESEPPLQLGSCALSKPEVAKMVQDAIKHFHGERYYLHAWCVMGNHLHVVYTAIGAHMPKDIHHSWKSFTAHKANKLLVRTGTFWESEGFDHLIRSVEDLEYFIEYVENNSVAAGLCAKKEDWPWSSAGTGWNGGVGQACGAGVSPAAAANKESRRDACTTTNVGQACGAGVSPAAARSGESGSRKEETQEEGRRDACTTTPTNLSDDRPLADDGTGAVAYADAVATYLAFATDKATDYWSVLCSWHNSKELIRNTFGRQALPMVWDYAEANPFQSGTGAFGTDWTEKVLRAWSGVAGGDVRQIDAMAALAEIELPVISTDPPYYDNIGYADLSDYFYVWLRRTLGRVYPSLCATLLTPKSQELIASPYRHDGSKGQAQSFFEHGLGKAFCRMREAHQGEFPLTVYYAFKQAESDMDDDEDAAANGSSIASTGWETMLEGLIHAGFGITGTWPMRTELGNRMVGSGTNALASSIILVCRPRPAAAPLATRKQLITALRQELPEALRNLQRGNIAPVDLAQAAIGPGMAIFTRYSKVMETDGSAMKVRTALGLINQALDEVLAEQEGEFDGDTRWALAWFEQFGMEEGAFGVAETLSKAKNTAVNGLVEAGVVKSRGGKVRLLKRAELPADWDPARDGRFTIWEATQHLIHILDKKGESGAAALMHGLGGVAETARDLAYRLYTVCERKKWADEALAYNGLVIAWPELTKLALAERNRSRETQKDLF